MVSREFDQAVRAAAFEWLRQEADLLGDVLPRDLLAGGFRFQGERVPLIGPQGIFKPRILDLPLTVTTVPPSGRKPRPYDDGFDGEGRFLYKYRGDDPEHRDNRGLRALMQDQVPLVYMYGVVEGQYLPEWPVYIVGDDRAGLCFTLDLERARVPRAVSTPLGVEEPKRYRATLVAQRLHQAAFRERVLRAYGERCCICRLHHRELLNAAHILPDRDPRSQPVVPNGLSLCTLHHGAFDADLIGISPDRVVHVRGDVMDEEDGPMLIHGLKGFNRERLIVPRSRALYPNPDYLAERFDRFRKAG